MKADVQVVRDIGLHLFVRHIDDVVIVDLHGKATIGRANDLLDNQLRQLIDEGSCKILLNLTDVTQMDAQAILDEIFPAVAYYQDTWGGELNRVLLTGFGEREETLRAALSAELKVNADNLADGASGRDLPSDARGMLSQGQEALVGWMANGA